MRLIDADTLRAVRSIQRADFNSIETVQQWIDDAPTIDAEPVRCGRWIWDSESYHCSECFFHAYGNTLECMDGTYNYCPNCGARMVHEE